MRRPRRAGAVALLAAWACAAPSFAQTQLQAYQRLRAAAAEAFRTGDPAGAERRLAEARAIYPNHPGALVQSARAQAAQGRTEDAIASLDAVAREGLVYDVAADPVLAPLAQARSMAAVAARFQHNARPMGRLARSRGLAGAGLPVEAIAFDPGRRRLIVSAVGGRRLVALDAHGRRHAFGRFEAAGGLYGLAVDAPRRRLWAAEASGPGLPGGGTQATALLCISLATGELIGRYRLESPGRRQLGDVAVGPDGSAFATDAAGGGVYRLRPGREGFEPLVRPGELGSPQGVAVVDAGRALIVADYPSGLHRIDLATGALVRLAEPADVTLAGVDGVAADGEDLILTQNGALPQRVLRVRLADHGRRIAGVATLLANPAAPAGPADLALGTVAGRDYVFVARSGWAKASADGRLSHDAAAGEAVIGWIELRGGLRPPRPRTSRPHPRRSR